MLEKIIFHDNSQKVKHIQHFFIKLFKNVLLEYNKKIMMKQPCCIFIQLPNSLHMLGKNVSDLPPLPTLAGGGEMWYPNGGSFGCKTRIENTRYIPGIFDTARGLHYWCFNLDFFYTNRV